MKSYNEVDGNLITLALKGKFDVIVHGVNCWNTMGSGLAPQMAKAFGCDTFKLESAEYLGEINKLGQIDYEHFTLIDGQAYKGIEDDLYVVNAYTQFYYGKYHEGGVDKPVDYDAITLVMRKLNHQFKGAHIGLPRIGAGLAGGIWDLYETAISDRGTIKLPNKDIKSIIKDELIDCNITVVNFKS